MISLEGVDDHVFLSVAKNHHRGPKTNDDSHQATGKSYFVDEFINDIY